MTATMILPTIKCSNCGVKVEISVMGDHVCTVTPSPIPPPPPPKSHTPSKSMGRSAGIPPPIDPSKANRPFMRLEAVMSSKGDITPFPGNRQSPPRPLLRSQTTPLPVEPRSPDQDEIPTFPLPRSMSQKMTKNMVPLDTPYSALPLPSGNAGDTNRGESIRLPLGEEAIAPPPPLPKDDVPGPLPIFSHKHSYSTDSRSSYRTSIASSRYGDSRRSTSVSMGRPSFGSGNHQFKYLDDAPPVPSSLPSRLLRDSNASSISELNMLLSDIKHDDRKKSHDGTDRVTPNKRTSYKAEDQDSKPSALRASSHTNSDHLSSNRGSAELFFRSPTPSSHGTPSDLPDLSQERSASPADLHSIEYKAYRSPGLPHLQPPSQELSGNNGPNEVQRKNSDTFSEGGLSVTNFAREMGLDTSDSAVEGSIVSSDSSPRDTRSGTSLSSIGSDASLPRQTASDQSPLGSLVEGLKRGNDADSTLAITDSDILQPPRIAETFFSPDSPTDPAISAGSVSLIPERPRREEPKEHLSLPLTTTSPTATSPATESPTTTSPTTERAARPSPRPKGPCRGCGEMIIGKSVSSADGRLTGRYHRACFVCYDCKTPFQTADFYVMNDLPYCAQHYHQRNGSVCHTCRTGIEGQYLETLERRGRGPADRYKFHPDCLTCRTCQVVLKGDYFEWNGQVYCERDARRAASVPPPRFQRPGPGPGLLAPSPLPHTRQPSRGYPRPPPPGYPGRPGPPGPPRSPGPSRLPPPSAFDGPYGAAPDGGRRFPERRTTRLMM
ncbi:hypothetical protein BDV29DRAFT_178962, partial [Aspergillus leporis]